MKNKAQVGLEYVFIFAFSLVAIGVLWVYATSNVENTKWDLQLTSAKSALESISQVADTTYVQGPPSQIYVYPNFPDNVQNVYVQGNSLILELLWKGDTLRNVTTETLSNITGNVSTSPGTHKILVRAVGSFIYITDA